MTLEVVTFITDDHMAAVAAVADPAKFGMKPFDAIGAHVKAEGRILCHLAEIYLDDPAALDVIDAVAAQAIEDRETDDAVHRAHLLTIYAGQARRIMACAMAKAA